MTYTTNHINNFLKLYNGEIIDVNDLNFNYIALGSGTTPSTPSDTQLESEQFRKQVTQKTRLTGAERTIVSILKEEANGFDIYEIGLFANATGLANSGTLVSRVVFGDPLPKTEQNVLNITRLDQITEGVV